MPEKQSTAADDCPDCGELSYRGGYCFGCGRFRPSKRTDTTEVEALDTCDFMQRSYGTQLTDLEPLIVTPQNASQNVVMLGGGSIGNPTDIQPIGEIMDRSIVIGNFFLTTPQNFTNGNGNLQIELIYAVINLN